MVPRQREWQDEAVLLHGLLVQERKAFFAHDVQNRAAQDLAALVIAC